MTEALRRDMEAKRIDIPLSLAILEKYNSGGYGTKAPLSPKGVPGITDEGIIDFRDDFNLSLPRALLRERLSSLRLELPEGLSGTARGENIFFARDELAMIGTALYSRTAFGILNGGVATSYADRVKNSALAPRALEKKIDLFNALSVLHRDKPKALTPAYINPDGSPGESFLSLKLRALELCRRSFRGAGFRSERQPLRLFQMTSDATDEALKDAMHEASARAAGEEAARKTALSDSSACEAWGRGEPEDFLRGRQALISAFTHSSEGFPKKIFAGAFGKKDSALALPGGHGQNFLALKGIYKDLRDRGYKYAYLTNIDNLGALPEPAGIAVLALLGKSAAFDFSFRTEVDVKGGILIRDKSGGLNCADLGSAVPVDEAERLEGKGEKILFNCATGLFDLDWLVPRLEEIAGSLPLRFSDEVKEIGRYSKAEQSTWEIMGLMDDFLVLAVKKEERFLSAKFLMETILSSLDARDGTGELLPPTFAKTVNSLRSGLACLLAKGYGMSLSEGRWRSA